MQRYIISEVLKMKWSRNEYHIYLFRRNDEVLYVGQSSQTIRRLQQHTHPCSKLKIGAVIRENMPESLNWLVEIYSLPECDVFVRMHRREDYEVFLRCLEWYPNRCNSATIAENAMIDHFQPTHNYTYKRLKEVS